MKIMPMKIMKAPELLRSLRLLAALLCWFGLALTAEARVTRIVIEQKQSPAYDGSITITALSSTTPICQV